MHSLPHVVRRTLGSLVIATATLATAQQAAPTDGITMDMMPITNEQVANCRQQASSQLADEQQTLHKREHQQDNDKMKQGAVTGVTGAATSAISNRGRWGGWWGNNNGANTAAATGATQRTERNSEAVASTTGIAQNVGADAYSQCIAGIKGPEYVHFRQTGKIEALGAFSAAPAAAAAPVATPVAAAAAVPAAAAAVSGSPLADTGDGKHFILTVPGESDPHEVTLAPGSKNSYIDGQSGDKYIVMPDNKVVHIKKKAGVKG